MKYPAAHGYISRNISRGSAITAAAHSSSPEALRRPETRASSAISPNVIRVRIMSRTIGRLPAVYARTLPRMRPFVVLHFRATVRTRSPTPPSDAPRLSRNQSSPVSGKMLKRAKRTAARSIAVE